MLALTCSWTAISLRNTKQAFQKLLTVTPVVLLPNKDAQTGFVEHPEMIWSQVQHELLADLTWKFWSLRRESSQNASTGERVLLDVDICEYLEYKEPQKTIWKSLIIFL